MYVSGAVLSADLGLPDIRLTTLTEVRAGAQIATLTARTVTVLEDAGLAGCHLEDQVNPKHCGHLDNKSVVPASDLVKRLPAAVSARCGPNFVVCARTGTAGGHRSGRFLLPDPESAGDGGERVAPSALQRRGGPRRHVTGKCWVMTRAISM